MRREYYPYYEWEDFNAGMWRTISKEEEEAIFNDVVAFTGNHMEYGNAMMEVIEAWPKTMAHNLTNHSINRKAFIGHCACCYKFGWPESVVRRAWKELTDEQQNLANDKAQQAYNAWYSQKNKELRSDMGAEVLF